MLFYLLDSRVGSEISDIIRRLFSLTLSPTVRSETASEQDAECEHKAGIGVHHV